MCDCSTVILFFYAICLQRLVILKWNFMYLLQIHTHLKVPSGISLSLTMATSVIEVFEQRSQNVWWMKGASYMYWSREKNIVIW